MPMLPLALAAALAGCAASSPSADGQTDEGVELLVTSAGPPVPRTCYKAPWLPSYVDGAYLVAGPALFEIGGYKFQALFDGYGRMNRFELRDGQVCYTATWMNTGMYENAMKEGVPHGLLFEETVPPRPKCPVSNLMCNLMAPNDNNWVNSIPVEGEVLMLSDTPTMVRMDLESLNCSRKSWADDRKSRFGPPQPEWVSSLHEGTTGSAHPLLRPGTQTYVDIIVTMAELPVLTKPQVDVYTFDAAAVGPQRRTKIATVKSDAMQYLHSFGVTPNYVVLPFNMKIALNPMHATLMGSFEGHWKGIHVVDKKGDVQVFDTEPFYHVHIVNTFENATGIVMDLGFYRDIPFMRNPTLDIGLFLNKTARDTSTMRSGIRRLHLHLAGPLKRKVTFEDLVPPGRLVDFFRINTAHNGLPYCIYYATEWWHDDRNYANMAIFKHDICKGTKTYWSRLDTYVGEPCFIGNGASEDEDDGVVVFVALDGRKRHSLFVTLDAKTFKELSAVELPGPIPFTAHGQFVPSGAGEARIYV